MVKRKQVLLNLQEACHWEGAGIGQYEQHMVRALARMDKYDLKGVYHRTNIEGEPFPFPTKRSNLPWTRLFRDGWETRYCPFSYNTLVGDHVSDVSIFMGSAMPWLRCRGKVICVIHDLISIRIPDIIVKMGWAHGDPAEAFRHSIRDNIIKRADVICTDSEFSRQEIAGEFGLDPASIAIVYPGVYAEQYRTPTEYDAFVRTKYRLPEKYLLYFGNMSLYKNVPNVVKGYARLPKDVRNEYHLVINGRKNEIVQLAIDEGVIETTHFLGYVDDTDKQSIYRAASGFAFLSRIEGFGMPVLEAMAAGVPVLTSDCYSLPEVNGGSGLVTSPDDLDEISFKMQKILVDSNERSEMISRGLKRAAELSWENCAMQMSRVIDSL